MNKETFVHQFVRILRVLLAAMLLALLALPAPLAPTAHAAITRPFDHSTTRPHDQWGKMPLYFIANQGQMDDRVAYYVQGSDKTLYFTAEGVTFALTDLTPQPPSLQGKGESPPLLIRRGGRGERSLDRQTRFRGREPSAARWAEPDRDAHLVLQRTTR